MKSTRLLSLLVFLTLSCSRNQEPPVANPPVEGKPAASQPSPAPPTAKVADPVSPQPSAVATAAATVVPAPVSPPPVVAPSDQPPVAAPAPAPAPAKTLVALADAPTNAPAKSIWDTVGGALRRATNLTVGASSNTTSLAPGMTVADLPTDQISRGLKEALGRGLDRAISQLGKDGGFLTNVNVRIPMPEKLQTVEKLLRKAGQDKLADDFEATMNHAAEKAVPAAAPVFADSLKQMSIEDARSILKGPPDAATQYFRRAAGAQLQEKFRPIVAQATAQTGVTAAYKNLMDRASFASAFIKQEVPDLDEYVTGKATDGLFKVVAEEEKKIRENPVARTTDLLKSVFGALGK